MVPPRTDAFHFELVLTRMRGAVYVDEVLVYDSEEGIQEEVALQVSGIS